LQINGSKVKVREGAERNLHRFTPYETVMLNLAVLLVLTRKKCFYKLK
jgi:hypothetical protein